MDNLFHCEGRNRRVYKSACPMCHLRKLCKMPRDVDKSNKSNSGKKHKMRLNVSTEEIMELRKQGLFMREIAEKLNVNRWTVAERIREAEGGR